ncbi:unnamed protein product [Rotaria socialis]|uniref:AAA+ ATPase domain-containing protein n=1 Tax=Rotaria socialis TaxID=392032 RepID=A0A818MNG6_9BILA|nr:unnamed protein product [Rotaria socialis]CAF3430550.1 unnamed protein product [Rotaria socialis]CAF3503212.1 unnamed protein product [Rotaria socialis]CAF3592280.1 unnamed protein product [Rotaria socialis]CAF3717138.1 unnamed protein product [Rotaria socialis]
MSSLDSQLYEWWLYEEASLERDKRNVDVFCHHRRVQLILLDTWRHISQVPMQAMNKLADQSIESYWTTRPFNKNAFKQTDETHQITFSSCINWSRISDANIRQKMMNDKARPLFKGHSDGRNPLCGQINLLSIKTPKNSSVIDNQPQTLNKKRPAPACFSDDTMDTSTNHHYRPPFGKQQSQQQPQAPQESLSFRTARDQLEIEEARTKGNVGGGVVKKSLGMHSSAKRSIYNRYVDPTAVRQPQGDSNRQVMPPPPPPTPVLQNNQSNNADSSTNKLEESGGAKHIDPKLIEMITSEIMELNLTTTWTDIAGLTDAKRSITEIVVWPMQRPDIFTGLRRPPKGLLLFGPPGTGKTLIGKCIASQSKATFFCVSSSSLTSKWHGESEKLVRALFAVARSRQPAVIFIDEVDSLLQERSENEDESTRRIKTEFLVQIDGASTQGEERLLLIGATNRPQELDSAARRRFVKRIYIPLPDLSARQAIISNLLKDQKHTLVDSDMAHICTLADGFSGADMHSLCHDAALGPIRDIHDIELLSSEEVRGISVEDFLKSLKAIRPSVSESDLKQYEDWNKTYGSM